MPNFSEAEMMTDLAAADAAGDFKTAQHIAGLIKAGRGPAPKAWENPQNPVARDLATIPRALKHGAMQLGNLVGMVPDEKVKAHRADMKADPMYGGVGDFVGGAMLAAPVVAAGVPLGMAGAVGTGLAAGGAFSDPGHRLAGAAMGGAGGLAGEAAKKMLPMAAHAIGNRFLNNKAGAIAAKRTLTPEATTKAYELGAIRPWKGIKGAAQTLEAAEDVAGSRVGESIRDIGRSTGAMTDAKQLSDEFLKVGNAIQAQSMNPGEYRPYFWAAKEVMVKGKGGQIPLDVAESIKSSLYKRAKPAFGTVQGADVPATPGAWRDIGSRMRFANEKSAEKAGATADQMGEFLAAKKGYGPIKDAFTAAGEGAARSGNRSFLSMPEAMMLATEGVTHAGALKAARYMLPQTIGYSAWRGGQAAQSPTAQLLIRALAAQGVNGDD